MTGVGRLHFPQIKTIVALVTFQKTEKEFSPSTMFKDYPVSRELAALGNSAQTSQASESGQNLIHHHERGYTMLFFTRSRKRQEGITAPLRSLDRLGSLVFSLSVRSRWFGDSTHSMPVEMFDENRRGG